MRPPPPPTVSVEARVQGMARHAGLLRIDEEARGVHGGASHEAERAVVEGSGSVSM